MAGENDKWEIYKDKDNLYRWKRIAKNGKVTGESAKGFPYKDNCIDNAKRSGYKV